MRKITYLILSVAVLMAFTSCSNNGNNDTPLTSTILPVTNIVSRVSPSGDTTSITYTYHYNGTQLVMITGDDSSSTAYTYKGNEIVSIISKAGATVRNTETLSYNSDGKLASDINLFSWEGPEYLTGDQYTYNADGTVSILSGYTPGTDPAALSWDSTKTTLCSLNADGDIIKQVQSQPGFDGVYTYEYDSHPDPSFNIAGFKAISLISLGYKASHNITKTTSEYTSNGTTYPPTVSTFTYTYNSDGYPISAVESNETTNETTSSYTYNK